MPAVSPGASTAGAAAGLPAEAERHEHSPEGQPEPVPAPPARTLADAGELLRALAAPVRIAIVLQLRDGDRCVHELVEALDVAQPLISQHLRVLKAAGVVHGERRGREVAYRLVDDHLAHIVIDAVEHVQEGVRA
ncbi:transcriptional regulator [Prauserella marina]|uniref:ArsR family transcriptional regulator n=1 Tax=Prauserella marina TaxID=530584 RepID=A0A222VN54_9PSEU|nr:metalloregulator ArsR/SmtB family transcription factor [Prauserella marina]ASR35193.1 transcriptional regulator [Prauserella marina]PWV85041.1 ArsR family transcriptional regulator [Prauserella marina]SDC06157.1 ArsR family transcriptional regulator [Prauserella marina]